MTADAPPLGTVESVGAYVPRSTVSAEAVGEAWDGFRARGVREKRVPAADEDAVTMAVAAARRALDDWRGDREAVDALAFGTTTPPLDEGDVGVTVSEVLGLGGDTEVSVHTQSTRAGARALVDVLRTEGAALAVAADAPRGSPADAVDHAAGAGAVAFLAGDGDEAGEDSAEGGTAVTVTDHATVTEAAPGTRFRRRGADAVETYGATGYERETYASVVGDAVAGLDGAVDAVAPTAPDGRLPGRAGRTVDAEVYHMADVLGDTGAASPLFGLLAAWDAGESPVALVGYGDGASADALALEGSLPVDTDWPAVERSYAEYLRRRGHLGGDC